MSWFGRRLKNPGVHVYLRQACDIVVTTGDTIELWWNDKPLMSMPISGIHHFKETVIFYTDAGVLGEGTALGGAFVE